MSCVAMTESVWYKVSFILPHCFGMELRTRYGFWLMLTGLATGESLCRQQHPAVFAKHMKALSKPFHQVTKLASVLSTSEVIRHIKTKKKKNLKMPTISVSLISL